MIRKSALSATFAASLLAAPVLASAAEDPGLQGDVGVFVAMFSETDIDDLGINADGTGFGLQGEVGNGSIFVFANYLDSGQDGTVGGNDFDLDSTEMRLGVGARSKGLTVSWVGRLERYDAELDLGGAKLEDDGMGIHVGVESAISESTTVYGDVGYLSLGESDGPEFRLGLQGKLAGSMYLFGEYRMLGLSADGGGPDVDIQDARVGAKFTF